MAKITKALVPMLLVLLLLGIGCAKKPPVITGISPSSGPSGGGTAVKLTGEKFKEGATIEISGKLINNISIDPEGTWVTFVTPGGPAGPQQIVAKNLKAKEASAPVTFTYEGLKVVNTTPTDGEQIPWYPRLSVASVKLSQPVEAGSVSLSIGDAAGEVTYDAATQTATFTSSEPLKTGVGHTVTVSGAKDMAGNVMADYTFSFNIEEAVRVDWYTVQEGDTLPIIAAKPEVYEDESKWKMIFEANQDEFMSEDGKHGNDAILDYRNLVPGSELYIPR
jgi:nucleoid-associated protein YgaU